MTALRIRPLRRILVVAALGTVAASALGVDWALSEVGRRDLRPGHALPAALTAAASVEAARLDAALRAAVGGVDALLEGVLARAPEVDPAAAVPWVPGLCAIDWPRSVARAGLVDVALRAPLSLVELTRERCLDRVGLQAMQAISGPPFPAATDVMRVAQAAVMGLDNAPHGRTTTVAVHREGTHAILRLARRQFARVAWVDLRIESVPGPPGVSGVRLDSVLMLDGVVVGYVHGGPDSAALAKAMDDVTTGKGRALDLAAVAERTSAGPVVALLHPEVDPGTHALGTSALFPDYPSGRLEIRVVASAPWPAPPRRVARVVATVSGAVFLLVLLLALLLGQRLDRSLHRTARAVRESWLGLRDDDEGSEEDRRRAGVLLDALSDGTRTTLEAAYGRGERFWAPAPIGRLLALLKKRLLG